MSKTKTTSFRPDKDVAEKIVLLRSLGWNISWIINTAIRTFKPKSK